MNLGYAADFIWCHLVDCRRFASTVPVPCGMVVDHPTVRYRTVQYGTCTVRYGTEPYWCRTVTYRTGTVP